MRITPFMYGALQAVATLYVNSKPVAQRSNLANNETMTGAVPNASALPFAWTSINEASQQFLGHRESNQWPWRAAEYTRLARSAQVSNVMVDEDLTETAVFRLFGMENVDNPDEKQFFEEPASARALITDLVEDEARRPRDPILYHLVSRDDLTYPSKLELTYRIRGHSPGETADDTVVCSGKKVPSLRQFLLSETMAQAVRLAADDLSKHTPFTLREAQAAELADIRVRTKVCGEHPRTMKGVTERPSSVFHAALLHPALSTVNAHYPFTQTQVENIVALFREKYASKSHITFILGEQFSTGIERGSAALYLAAHELNHALGLVDVSWFSKNECEILEGYCLARDKAIYENTVIAYDSMPFLPAGCAQNKQPLPQTLMPYDYAALNMIAQRIRQLNGESATPANEASRLKSPYQGDTYYRFDANAKVIDIEDCRSAADVAQFQIFPARAGHVQLTIVDPGGWDTLDFRTFRTAVNIDIRPGGVLRYDAQILAHSQAVCDYPGSEGAAQRSAAGCHPISDQKCQLDYSARGNVYLPIDEQPDSLLESVVTGSGNDIVIGNAADNLFHLGKGRDTVTGGLGCDDYVVTKDSRHLTITDFDPRCDRLVLDPKLGIRNHAQFLRHVRVDNDGLDIHLHRKVHVTLKGVADKSDVTPENILVHTYTNQRIHKNML
ncbi:MAG: M10 family metallopeptidase C-terminal domain-containing protein [Ottowia sp.]|nr:M10 family metallopeptidase C-terminal domain-containing protein [Ottowia sp.]